MNAKSAVKTIDIARYIYLQETYSIALLDYKVEIRRGTRSEKLKNEYNLRSRVSRPRPRPAMSARRGEGLSGGCKAGLTLKEKDSFLLPPRPWLWCGGGVGSARCSLGTHPPVRAVHVSASNAGMLGDLVRARKQMTL